MKQIFIICFIAFIISAEAAVEERFLIEPPLPLSQELPITLSQTNRQTFISNPEVLDQEAKHNAAFVKSKSFPWLYLISALGVGMAILFIRLFHAKSIEEPIDPHIKEKKELEIKEALKLLLSQPPRDANETTKVILQIDFLLRSYLQNKYDWPAFSYTVQELDQKMETLPDLTPSIKEGMNKTFETADKIKFAGYTPSTKDFPVYLGNLFSL
jgi:hypothetical protein